MQLKTTLFLITIFPMLALAGNNPSDSVPSNLRNFNHDIDSLASLWFNKQMSSGTDTSLITLEASDSIYIPDFADAVYMDRLSALPSVMELSYNTTVRNYIHMYTHKRRDLVEQMLGLSEFYFPIFEELLDSKNLPIELKYLPVIESALNPNAVSRVGATGLWQFMYYTGKSYKLEINSFVDERRDPIKSTYAAMAFLSDLYTIYQDWTLVIAAYNCGPGNVNKAIRRSGGKRDYWQIYYYLPRETRGYVPAFIAATYVMNYYDKHNLKPVKTELPILCDTIMVNQQVHLEQISSVIGIQLSELQSLNPQYRRNIIPGKTKAYSLRLPLDYVSRYIDLEDSVLAYRDSFYFNPEIMNKAPERSNYTPGAPPSGNYATLYYKVKSGDNLGFIAGWYDVSVSDLRYWNNIHRNTIRSGQRLTIYVPKSKVEKYKSISDMTFEQKQGKASPATSNTVSSSSTGSGITEAGEYEFYVVRNGDTLWEIAKQYPGVTDTDIMRWNQISNARNISVGQKLKIKKKS